jgi:hypothetical protein
MPDRCEAALHDLGRMVRDPASGTGGDFDDACLASGIVCLFGRQVTFAHTRTPNPVIGSRN